MSFLSSARAFLPLAFLCVAAAGCDACDTRATHTGEFNNLQFVYEPADFNTKFNRPLATGSNLTMYVLDTEKNKVHQINSVHSSNDSALTVQPHNNAPNAIRLVGQREGKTQITVQATTNKGQKEDTFPFEVINTNQVSLQHSCTDDANAAYLLNTPTALDFMRSNKGRVLVGHAQSCSVQVEPAEIDPSVRCDEANFHLPAFDSVGSIRLTPQFNNQAGRKKQLGVQIVSPQIIDFLPPEDILSVGSTSEINIFAQTNTEPYWPLCTPLTMEVVIETPSICSSPQATSDEFVIDRSKNNTFSLRGDRPGECFFTIIFPQISRQEIWEFSVPVER